MPPGIGYGDCTATLFITRGEVPESVNDNNTVEYGGEDG